MSINTPVAAKYEKVSGFWYVVDASDKQIVARCNSQVVADEIVSALNGVAEARYLANFIVNNRRNFFTRDTDGVGNRAIDQLAAWLERQERI